MLKVSHRDMSPSRCLLSFPFLLLVLCGCTAHARDEYLLIACNSLSNVSSGSQVAVNIRQLVAELVSKTELNGYIATTYGKDKNKVYGLAQCRGDVSKKDCRNCIKRAAKRASTQCPNKSDTSIWYDYCYMRYNLENFFNTVDTGFGIYTASKKNVTDPETFNKKLGALIAQIESQAIKPENHGLGKGEVKLSGSTTLYALVQCTRDLSSANCAKCLKAAVGNYPQFCENRTGCRFAYMYAGCYTRYDLNPFFFPLGTAGADEESPVSVMTVGSP